MSDLVTSLFVPPAATFCSLFCSLFLTKVHLVVCSPAPVHVLSCVELRPKSFNRLPLLGFKFVSEGWQWGAPELYSALYTTQVRVPRWLLPFPESGAHFYTLPALRGKSWPVPSRPRTQTQRLGGHALRHPCSHTCTTARGPASNQTTD